MSRASWGKRILAVFGVTLVVLGSTYFYLISPHHSSAPPESAEGLLDRADTLAWGNRWADAQPLYARAQHLFDAQKQRSKALYAEVSQVPPDESGSVPGKIFQLTQDLGKPCSSRGRNKAPYSHNPGNAGDELRRGTGTVYMGGSKGACIEATPFRTCLTS